MNGKFPPGQPDDEQRSQAGAAFKQLILELSATFINLPLSRFDNAIHDALALIGEHFHADRAYVFVYEFQQGITRNTHEWCAPQITPYIEQLQAVPLRLLREQMHCHEQGQPLLIADVAAMPDSAFKKILQEQSVSSLLTLPMMNGRRCLGFVGLDAVKTPTTYDADQLALLKLFGDLLANLHSRRAKEEQLTVYQLAVDQSAEGICFTDMQGQIIFVNTTWARLHGYTVEALIGQPLSIFHTVEQLKQQVQPVIDLLIATGGPFSGEVDHCRKDGSVFPSSMTTTMIKSSAGQPLGMFAQMRDITEQRATQQKLLLASKVFDHAREGIVITDPTGAILDINQTFTEITGYSKEEVIHRNPRLLQSGEQAPAFYESLWESLRQHGEWSGELWNKRKNGEIYPQRLVISAVKTDAGVLTHYVGLLSDITEVKSMQSELEHMAYFDSLTRLPNRVLLMDRLQQQMLAAQRQGKVLAIAYIDLDGFKGINDRFDHHMGDLFLVEMSARLHSALRHSDTLARVGGDEFVVLMPGLGEIREALLVVQRLLSAASQSVTIDGHALHISASIGVNHFPLNSNDERSAARILQQADQAMYAAKESGKNRYHLVELDGVQDTGL